jgi:hypothetical protein
LEFGPEKRKELGIESRRWAINQYDSQKVCVEIDTFLDSIRFVDWDMIILNEEYNPKNESSEFPDMIQDDDEFITCLYENILYMNEPPNGSGRANWINQLKNGTTRQQIYQFFIDTAKKENQEKGRKQIEFADLLDNNGNKRALFLLKESFGDAIIATSLFESFKQKYPDTDLYVMCDPKYSVIYDGNPYIHKVLPYIQQAESELVMTGAGQNNKFFDYYFHVAISTQRVLNYLNS